MRSARAIFAAFALPPAALACLLFACETNDAASGQGLIVTDEGTCEVDFDASHGAYPLSSLPTGQACAPSTSCTLPVDTCAADFAKPYGGPNLTIYGCFCGDGGWACYAGQKVDTTCDDDAGAGPTSEAASDAPADAPVDALGE